MWFIITNAFSYHAKHIFSEQTDFCMYTYFYRRRAKTQASAMAPRKASKENVEVSRQGLDNVADTSP
jgi:hypothetical protein